MSAEEFSRRKVEADIESWIEQVIAGAPYLRFGEDEFDWEEMASSNDPWIFVRKRDGARFEIEISVSAEPTVRRLRS